MDSAGRLEDVVILEKGCSRQGIVGAVYDLYSGLGLEPKTDVKDIDLVYHNAIKLVERANSASNGVFADCSRILHAGKAVLCNPELKERYDRFYKTPDIEKQVIPFLSDLDGFVSEHIKDVALYNLARRSLETHITLLMHEKSSLRATARYCITQMAKDARDNAFWALDATAWKGKRAFQLLGGFAYFVAYGSLLVLPMGLFGGFGLTRGSRYFSGQHVDAHSASKSLISSFASVQFYFYYWANHAESWVPFIIGAAANAASFAYGMLRNVHDDKEERRDRLIGMLREKLSQLDASSPISTAVNPGISAQVHQLVSKTPQDV